MHVPSQPFRVLVLHGGIVVAEIFFLYLSGELATMGVQRTDQPRGKWPLGVAQRYKGSYDGYRGEHDSPRPYSSQIALSTALGRGLNPPPLC